MYVRLLYVYMNIRRASETLDSCFEFVISWEYTHLSGTPPATFTVYTSRSGCQQMGIIGTLLLTTLVLSAMQSRDCSLPKWPLSEDTVCGFPLFVGTDSCMSLCVLAYGCRTRRHERGTQQLHTHICMHTHTHARTYTHTHTHMHASTLIFLSFLPLLLYYYINYVCTYIGTWGSYRLEEKRSSRCAWRAVHMLALYPTNLTILGSSVLWLMYVCSTCTY